MSDSQLNRHLKCQMSLAMQLAAQSLPACAPNPAVGCTVISPEGALIGQGHTQQVGGPHAEVMALRDAQARGHSVVGATVYVTLEPCSHHGRTGPCCDALIAAGIKKVVSTHTDPNPLVSGQGFARLRAAGVEVELLPTDHPLAIQSRELNIGFFSRMIRKQPWVRMKVAASLDGKTALANGVSQWITSPEARQDGHAWRARACAVLTGMGTLTHDNPRLDVRLVDTPRQPHLVIVDGDLETPLNAALWAIPRRVLIYTGSVDSAKANALRALGATVIHLPCNQPNSSASGKVDLASMLKDMGQREINELHVEAGYRLNGAFIRAGLVDELVVYLAPTWIGQGRDMAQWGPITELAQALPLEFNSTQMVGPDLRVVARVSGRDHF